jgi:hypothetical protein
MTIAARLLLTVLFGAAVAACGATTPTPSPTAAATPVATTIAPTAAPATPAPTPSAAPSSAPSPSAGAQVCGIGDLKASHGLVDGAAGSILTEIVLESSIACSVDTSPSLGLQDKSGYALVPSTPAGPGSIKLVAGDAYTTQVRLANWCAPDPAFPLALVLWIDGDKLVVTGGSFPVDGMPGCLGTGGVRLESTPWVASP